MYQTIIFDMDGVITTEERYWDASAFTVAEFCGFPIEDPAVMRKKYFCDNRLIPLLKNQGVNTNYELAYLAIAFHEPDSEKQYRTMAAHPLSALYEMALPRLAARFGLLEAEVGRDGAFWERLKNSLHEWFLGSERFAAFHGKTPVGGRTGLSEGEVPLVGIEPLRKILTMLYEKGIRLCIGTGRPKEEALSPLRAWGVLDLFDKERMIFYSHIAAAEIETGVAPLKKPHPYSFIKAYFGENFSDADIVAGRYKKDFSDCLIVGDAGADLFAAKAMGADFAAVLTGVGGKAGRPFFEENHAEHIIDDITELAKLF